MAYIKRHLEDVVLEAARTWPALLVTGARQTGKTTLLRHLAEQEGLGRRYVTLEDMEARLLAHNDPEGFLEIHQPPVLIDEVQYAPKLFSAIRRAVDEQHSPGAFWMAGSGDFRLMEGFAESLAGCMARFTLCPLSQRELIGADCVPFVPDPMILISQSRTMPPASLPELFRRIWQGSLPGLVGTDASSRSQFYSSYIATCIEQDARALCGDIDVLQFYAFLCAVAARTALAVSYRALAEEANTTLPTARKWLKILEALGLVFLVHPSANKAVQRQNKPPKLYFYDTGLVCTLARWPSAKTAAAGAMSGALMENFAVSEIVKGYCHAGQDLSLCSVRGRAARHIDMQLAQNDTLHPLAIRKRPFPDKRIGQSFAALDKRSLQKGTGAILCAAAHLTSLNPDTWIVPFWML